MPAAAKGTSKKSAEAFVRYAVEVLNYTALSLRTEELRRISDSECTACDAVTAFVARVRSEGGEIEGGEWTSSRLAVVEAPGRTDSNVIVQALIRSNPQVVREAAAAEVKRYPAGKAYYTFSSRAVFRRL